MSAVFAFIGWLILWAAVAASAVGIYSFWKSGNVAMFITCIAVAVVCGGLIITM